MLLYIFICCVLFIVIFFNLIFSPFSYFSFYLVVCLVHALSCVICYQSYFFWLHFIYLFIYLFILFFCVFIPGYLWSLEGDSCEFRILPRELQLVDMF